MGENNFINENVGLFYAKDKNENLLLISEIDEHNKNIDLLCPICETQVRPRAINSDKVSQHFYHVNANDHSSETILHWWYKNAYIVKGDRFMVGEYEYECKDVLIEHTYYTSYGNYMPDVSILTESNEVILFEYNYSNKKNATDYEEKWIELGHNVVEINIKDLLKSDVVKFNPLFLDGVVMCAVKSKRYGVIDRLLRENNIKDLTRIKYLNGFLRDLRRYQSADLSIEDLAIIIDEMNESDKMFIPKMIGKLKCQSVLDDYAENKRKQLIQRIIDKDKNISYEAISDGIKLKYRRGSITGSAKFKNTIQIGIYDFDVILKKPNEIIKKARYEIDNLEYNYKKKIEHEEWAKNEKAKKEKVLAAIEYGKSLCHSPYELKVNHVPPFNYKYRIPYYERVVSLELRNEDRLWTTATKTFENCHKADDINSEVEKIIDKMKKRIQRKIDDFNTQKQILEQHRMRLEENKAIRKKIDITYREFVIYFKNSEGIDFDEESTLRFSKTGVFEIQGDSITITFGSRRLMSKVDNWRNVIDVVEKLV